MALFNPDILRKHPDIIRKPDNQNDWERFVKALNTGQIDGSALSNDMTVAGDWDIQGSAYVRGSFRVYDSTGNDYLTISHDGAQANFTGTNTSAIRFFNTTYIMSGGGFRVYDATNTDYISLTHNGSNATISVAGASSFFLTGAVIDLASATNLRLRDSDNDATVLFGHDGTDFNMTFANTTDWNIGSVVVKMAGTLEVGTPQTYSPTNVSADRAYDANSTTTEELADVLGTLIADLQTIGLIN